MKNKILLFILAVLIFIPSVVAGVSYFTNKDGKITTNTATTLSIRDTEGVVYTFEKGKSTDADDMIEIFAKMESGAEKRVALPDSVAASPSFSVTYSVAGQEAKFEYYLTRGSDNAYFIDASGNAYQIKAEDAELFLATSYAQSIYSESKVPSMTVSGEYKVNPSAAQWMYKNNSGNYVAADTEALLSSGGDYSLEGGLSLEFSAEPDSVHVKVLSSSGEVLFDDSYANIASLRITEGTKVSVEIDAKWYEDDQRNYYGELSYKFTATVSAPAEFYPGATTAEVGEFVSLTGVNVKDPSKITFTSEPSIDYIPVFVTDEQNPQYVRALIPFKVTLAPGAYEFTVTYAGTSQTISFELTERVINTREYDIDAATAATYYTESAIADFNSSTAEAAALVSPSKQWDGYFLQGEDFTNITFGFGHIRTIASVNASYNHTGVDYSAPAGVDVPAANNGTVVFSGVLELTGYTVVIDHGFGLKTWYYHMSEVSVNEGDVLKKGDTIGKTGKTGLTNQNGVHIGMSVCDVFVSPYATWSDGEWKDVPLYSK